MESYKDPKKLKKGFTTGSCAVGASKAAALILLGGGEVREVPVQTPGGTVLHLPVLEISRGDGWVRCAVRKDSGDDPDITNGLLIFSTVALSKTPGIVIDGGEGVGRVTKPGLDQPVGSAAINTVPRRMITAAVREAVEALQPGLAGLSVRIDIPGGEEIAKKTFNPRLGIEGGLSILGTTGIVEPMSEQALVDTIRTELSQLSAMGEKNLLITPGNYGETFIREHLDGKDCRAVICSNFLGETFDMAREMEFKSLLLVGHIGKLAKLACGVMNTHSRFADCRAESIAAAALRAGAERELVLKLLDTLTTDQAVSILKEAGFLRETMEALAERMQFYLEQRLKGAFPAGVLFFSNQHGFLGMTRQAAGLLDRWKLTRPEGF